MKYDEVSVQPTYFSMGFPACIMYFNVKIQFDAFGVGTVFANNVVWNSVNTAFSDQGSILDQIYEKQICLDFYYDDFIRENTY